MKLFVLSVFFSIFFVSISSVVFNEDLYLKYQEKHAVAIEDKAEINHQLIQHFLGKDNMPSVFNEKEAAHMGDVKTVLQHMGLFFLLFFILGLYFALSLDNPLDGLFKGSLAVLIFILILGILPFGFLFAQFHEIFFQPGTWVFSDGSFIITLYPHAFFNDMFYNLVYRILGVSLVLLVVSKIVARKKFKYNVSIRE